MRKITSYYYEENYQNLVLRMSLLGQVCWATVTIDVDFQC